MYFMKTIKNYDITGREEEDKGEEESGERERKKN